MFIIGTLKVVSYYNIYDLLTQIIHFMETMYENAAAATVKRQ